MASTTTALVRITTSQTSYFPHEEVEIRLDFLSTSLEKLQSYTGYRTLIPQLFYDELSSQEIKKDTTQYYTMNPQLQPGEIKLNQIRICFYGLITANPSWITLDDSKISYSHIPKKRNSRLLLCSMPKNMVVNKVIQKKKKMTFIIRFSLPGTEFVAPTYKGTNFRVKYGLSLEIEMIPFGSKQRSETHHIPVLIKNPISSFRRILTSGRIFNMKFQFTTHIKKQSLRRKIIDSADFQDIDSEIRYQLSKTNGTGNYQIRSEDQEIGKVVVPKLGYRIGEDVQVVFHLSQTKNNNEESEEEEKPKKKKENLVKCVAVKCSLACLEKVDGKSLRIAKTTYEEEIGRKVICTESRVLVNGVRKVGFCFKTNIDETSQFKTDVFDLQWLLAFSFWVQKKGEEKKEEMKWSLPIFVYPAHFFHGKTVSSGDEFMIV